MDHDNPDVQFLGKGWRFPPRFDLASRDSEMVTYEDDIRESLHILFSTYPGERVMHPGYGCDLNRLIFENIDESTITEIKDAVDRAVLFFEPRIQLNTIDVDLAEAYEGLIKIQLNYTVRSTNSRSNMVYPFYFMDGPHIGGNAE